MNFSPVSSVVTLVVILVMVSSIYNFYQLFSIPTCDEKASCLSYYLKNNPPLQLALFTSTVPVPSLRDTVTLVASVKPFDYGNSMDKKIDFRLPMQTRNNGSLYLQVLVVSPEKTIEGWVDAWRSNMRVWTNINLIKYQVPSASTFDLLKGGTSAHERVPVSHIKTEVAFRIVVGIDSLPRNNLPLELRPFITEVDSKTILPILHYDFLHERASHLTPIGSNRTVSINVHYQPINAGLFRLMVHTEGALKSLYDTGLTDKDVDQLKGIIAGTNLYLLLITFIVSSLHLLFDFLALKSDVIFWKERKTLEGISPRTVLWRAASQTIIILYLFDETTSMLILGPAVISTLIEWWKVQKIYVPMSWRSFKRKEVKLNKKEQATMDLDAEGMRYLYYICAPLCLIGAWYSLVYLPHKSWYSWLVHSLANGVYAFGFLLMLPQLFINYKLKTVEHMPWKKFMYKAMNTFIDDLFAFIIEMPTAHRLACLRDDVVFFIYLYQRWLYPIDKKRTSEEHTKID